MAEGQQMTSQETVPSSKTSSIGSLLQQPAPKTFKLSKIELMYEAKKFKVPRSPSKLGPEDPGFNVRVINDTPVPRDSNIP